MNDMETAPSHSAPAATDPAQEHAVDFNRYLRRCGLVFAAALCMISLMVAASFAPIGGWPVKVAVILTIACANALVVAGFLMHLISEKKMIYAILAFTVFFVVGLFALTLYAMKDFPSGTVTH
jgi:caa(3)-type oxidase subunit IV